MGGHHLIYTGLQLVTRISIEICFNEFNTKNSKRSLMISGIITSSNAALERDLITQFYLIYGVRAIYTVFKKIITNL